MNERSKKVLVKVTSIYERGFAMSRFVKVVIALSVVAMMIVGTLTLSGYGMPLTENQPAVTPSPADQASEIQGPNIVEEDLGNGWVKVTDYKFGISFERPAEWYYEHGVLSSYDGMEAGRTGKYQLFEYDIKVQIGWVRPEDELLPLLKKDLRAASITPQYSKVIKQTERSINGFEVIQFTEESVANMDFGTLMDTYHIRHNENFFRFSMSPVNSIHRDTLEKIILTIEFLEQ